MLKQIELLEFLAKKIPGGFPDPTRYSCCQKFTRNACFPFACATASEALPILISCQVPLFIATFAIFVPFSLCAVAN